jgi:hypothetical protein
MCNTRCQAKSIQVVVQFLKLRPIGSESWYTFADMKAEKPQKSKADEYATFETALKKVLTVSNEDMKKKLKKSSSSRASASKA